MGDLELVEGPLPKVSGDVMRLAAARPSGSIAAIVKVAKAGYVPSVVSVRSRISSQIFTAEVSTESLAALDKDPQVVSVSVATKVYPAEE